MGRKAVAEGTVVLVDKVPQTIAPTTLERVKVKKELSDKQKANLAKLIEANKAKALLRKAPPIPEVIPEDKVVAVVRPVRKYNRKPKENNKENNVIVNPSETEAEEETEEEEPKERPKLRRQKALVSRPSKPRRSRKVVDDTSDATSLSEDSDSGIDSEEEKINKYVAKAHKRMNTLNEIDKRLKVINNKYMAKGLSVF